MTTPEIVTPNDESYAGPKVSCVLIDPPTELLQTGNRGADQHYDVVSMARLAQLPVNEMTTDNAHLWLWTTNAALRESYDLAEAWGFTVRSPLVWIKPRLGLGHYLRNASEVMLFATKGKAPVQFRSQPTWMFAPVQDHSHKPEEQYAVIERVSGPGTKLELFARRRPPKFPGTRWLVWGNETDSDIRVPGWPVPSDYDEQAVLAEGGDA